MSAEEPSWWYNREAALAQRLLDPVARIWAWSAVRRLRTGKPHRVGLPVVCVGNFTAGGTGKTPLALYLARALADRGERPAFLTRGYGGRLRGPHVVDTALDTAADVGDEPLLLARQALTVVARDRAKGAALIAGLSGLAPPTAIVMDDGLQNPGLAKDLSIAVVDARRGLGNGRVIPAGPLRAPLAAQLRIVDAIVDQSPRHRRAGFQRHRGRAAADVPRAGDRGVGRARRRRRGGRARQTRAGARRHRQSGALLRPAGGSRVPRSSNTLRSPTITISAIARRAICWRRPPGSMPRS